VEIILSGEVMNLISSCTEPAEKEEKNKRKIRERKEEGGNHKD